MRDLGKHSSRYFAFKYLSYVCIIEQIEVSVYIVKVAVPSRTDVKEYQELKEQMDQASNLITQPLSLDISLLSVSLYISLSMHDGG